MRKNENVRNDIDDISVLLATPSHLVVPRQCHKVWFSSRNAAEDSFEKIQQTRFRLNPEQRNVLKPFPASAGSLFTSFTPQSRSYSTSYS